MDFSKEGYTQEEKDFEKNVCKREVVWTKNEKITDDTYRSWRYWIELRNEPEGNQEKEKQNVGSDIQRSKEGKNERTGIKPSSNPRGGWQNQTVKWKTEKGTL